MPSGTDLILGSRARRGVSKDARSRRSLKQRQLWPKWLWVLLAVASGALFVGSTGAPAAEISDGIVKIGLILDLSGPYSENTGQGSATAAKMAVDDFGGKVLGAPIELVVADHHNSADRAAAIARDWFDAQHIDAILDVSGSSEALIVQRVADTATRSCR